MQQPTEGRTFGWLLREYRANAGLTQEQLAERAGLSRRGIADLERGARRTPHAHTMERLATALGLSSTAQAALVEAVRHQGATSSASIEPRPRALPTSADPLEPGAGPGVRHNVPLRPTSFVGRQAERAQLARRIRSSPLMTLVGPGGDGQRADRHGPAGKCRAPRPPEARPDGRPDDRDRRRDPRGRGQVLTDPIYRTNAQRVQQAMQALPGPSDVVAA